MNRTNRLACVGMYLLITSTLAAEPMLSAVRLDDETTENTNELFCQHTSSRMGTRAYPIAFIEQEAIDVQHQKLVQELKLNTLARYGVKAATAAVILYMAYTVWLEHAGSKQYVVPVSHEGALQTPTLEQVAADTHAIGTNFQAYIQEYHPQRFSWQWFKNSATSVGWSVVNIALAKGVFDRGEQYIDSIMHNGNLDWFVKTHTRSLEALVELTEYVHTHDASGTSEREHAHHKEQIRQVAQSFMNHMTAILGFMSYSKSITQEAEIRVNMHTLIEYFRVTCNEFAHAVSSALEQDVAVTPHISKMSVELNRLLMSFMRLEREQISNI